MIALEIHLNGDGLGRDLKDTPERIIHLGNDAPPIHISVLDGGMRSGKASIMLRIDLPDGKVVLAETSLALFLTAAKAFAAKFPDQAREYGL